MDNYFAREAEIWLLHMTLIGISLEYFHMIGTYTKLSCLNV